MAFCRLCHGWYNCFCLNCRDYNPYDNSFPRKDKVIDDFNPTSTMDCENK